MKLENILGNWTPHGHCYDWAPDILWLNVLGDAGTFLAYLLIPIAFLRILKLHNASLWKPFKWGLFLFSAFIFLCGVSHLIDIFTVWNGNMYRIQAYERILLAIVSLLTAGALWSKKALKIKINTYLLRNNTVQVTEIELPPIKIKRRRKKTNDGNHIAD